MLVRRYWKKAGKLTEKGNGIYYSLKYYYRLIVSYSWWIHQRCFCFMADE